LENISLTGLSQADIEKCLSNLTEERIIGILKEQEAGVRSERLSLVTGYMARFVADGPKQSLEINKDCFFIPPRRDSSP